MATARSLDLNVVDESIPNALHTVGGFRPNWLLTNYENHEWLVQNIGEKNPRVISFNVTVPGGRKLKDYPNLYESIKRIAYGVRTGPLAEVDSAEVQLAIVSNLTTLACWMIGREIERFSQLTNIDREEYAALAVYGVHSILNTESTLERHLEAQVAKANFAPGEEKADRRNKAKAVFPFKKANSNTSTVVLDRRQVLADAGLDHIGFSSNVLASLFDEFEALCCFYQPSIIKSRKAKSRDDQEDKPISEEHLRRFLMSFKYLYEHRRYLNDAPLRDPLVFTSARAEARKLGAEIGRTGTVPIKQATHLIERSARWVLDYSPLILDLKRRADEASRDSITGRQGSYAEHLKSIKTWPSGPASPFPIQLERSKNFEEERLDSILAESGSGGMTIHGATISLMTACSIVIAAFTARRVSEIIGLKYGSLYTDESGKLWLSCFIHKTLRTESQIPVPEIVAVAINVLEQISEKARGLTEVPYIFQYNVPGTSRTHGLSAAKLPNFALSSHLRRFGYLIDVPQLDDGTRWTFKGHQFRRFFAILYIWVYDKGDWGALQYHLRHFTREMTRRYVTETDMGQIIAYAAKEHTAQILANAASGINPIGGIEGTRLKEAAERLRNQMARKVEVVSERKYRQKLEKLVDRTGLQLAGFPWGYCVKRKGQEENICNCTSTGDADFTKASETVCTGCECNMLTSSALPIFSAAIRMHQNIVDSPDSPPILRNASHAICQKLNKAIAEIS